jgi:SAM-dependent methyltransferase
MAGQGDQHSGYAPEHRRTLGVAELEHQIDVNAELIETARARAAAAGFEQVSFVVGDAGSVELDRDFDAVVGRCVLFFAREPATLVRRLTKCVRDGGIVAFQEPANATLAPMSLPRSQLLERLWAWILETYRRANMDLYIGLRLRSIFAEAGLAAPAVWLPGRALSGVAAVPGDRPRRGNGGWWRCPGPS